MKESTLAREYQRSYNIDLNTKLEEEHKVSAIYSIDALNKVG